MQGSPGIDAIRPLGLSDIVDAAIRMYRHNFGPFLGIVAIAYVPVFLGQMLLVPVMMAAESSTGSGSAELTAMLPVLAILGVIVLTSMVSAPLSQATLIWAISERYLGRTCGVKDAYRAVFAKFGSVVTVMLGMGIATCIGGVLCIIPGVVIGILFSFSMAEVMINGKGARAAMERSWNLVLLDFWKVFVTLLVFGILFYILSTVLSIPLGLLAVIPMMVSDGASALYAQSVTHVLQVFVGVVVMPVQIIGTILLYYDMRVRHEGFDLQILAQSIEARGGAGTHIAAQAPSLLTDTASSDYVKPAVPPIIASPSPPGPVEAGAPSVRPMDAELPPRIEDDGPE